MPLSLLSRSIRLLIFLIPVCRLCHRIQIPDAPISRNNHVVDCDDDDLTITYFCKRYEQIWRLNFFQDCEGLKTTVLSFTIAVNTHTHKNCKCCPVSLFFVRSLWLSVEWRVLIVLIVHWHDMLKTRAYKHTRIHFTFNSWCDKVAFCTFFCLRCAQVTG